MTTPKRYDHMSALPEYVFAIPLDAPKTMNTDLLQELLARTNSLVWLLLSCSESDKFDVDDKTLRSVLWQITTHVNQAEMMFDHCLDDGGEG